MESMSSESYQKIVADAFPAFFAQDRHLIDDAPEVRPIVLYAFSSSIRVAPWSSSLAWKMAAEEISVLQDSEERQDDHEKLFMSFHDDKINNRISNEKLQEFYATYPLWSYVFTKQHKLYAYAACANALLPHREHPWIVPYICHLTDRTQMRTLYLQYRESHRYDLHRRLDKSALFVEIWVEEEGMSQDLKAIAVRANAHRVLRNQRISFSNPRDGYTWQRMAINTFMIILQNTLEKNESVDQHWWDWFYEHITSTFEDSEENWKILKQALEETPPTTATASYNMRDRSSSGILRLLRCTPNLFRRFLELPRIKHLFLTATVIFYPQIYYSPDETIKISLLLASYIVERPLGDYYEYDQTALLIEATKIDRSAFSFIIENVLHFHEWNTTQLLDVLSTPDITSEVVQTLKNAILKIYQPTMHPTELRIKGGAVDGDNL